MTDIDEGRATLSHFTPEKPLIVPKAMYEELAKIPGIADMMDRVRANEPIPDDLYDADPNCEHELNPNSWSGVKCLKCPGWFCY